MEVNKINYPKKIKHTNLFQTPMKCRWYTQALIRLLTPVLMKGCKSTIEKINMEGLEKTPYLLLINHMQFLDFAVTAKATRPRKINNVVAIDAFDNSKRFLMYRGGCIVKRKFINDIAIVKNLNHCLKKLHTVAAMYPEARYTHFGTNAILPDSLGKMIKLFKVPVATLIFQGHHLLRPTWGDGRKRLEVPIHATLKQIITAEQIETMSVPEINAVLKTEFVYDEYRYWQESGFKITYKNRAQGIHNILYKCPVCKAEYEMTSGGAELKCGHCGSIWELTENGLLHCKTGETAFKHIPDWCEWERSEVRKELEAGTYEIKTEMEAVSMPHGKYVIPIGRVKFLHNSEGFNITGHYNGEDFHIVKTPPENYGVQTEFFFPRLKKRHTIGLSTNDDSFYFFPTTDGMMQKLYFGVEELYKIIKK